MVIVFKGKGILVPAFLVLSFFIVIGLYHLLKNSFGLDIIEHSVFILFGLTILTSGILTRYAGRDYYKNRNGEKVEIDLDNRFFFIKMKVVGKIFIVLGIILAVYGIYDHLKK